MLQIMLLHQSGTVTFIIIVVIVVVILSILSIIVTVSDVAVEL